MKAGILDKVVLVIHGDHGSRILINQLYESEHNNPEAHKEAHSTIFTVRIPGQKASYNNKTISIGAVLWKLIANGFSQVPDGREPGEQTIFVPNTKTDKPERIKCLGGVLKDK